MALAKSFSSQQIIDETYDLRGLDLTSPDQAISKGQTPYLRNSRMYARDSDEGRFTARIRKGSQRLMTAVGQTMTSSITTAGTGDVALTPGSYVAFQFSASSLRQTRLDLNIKKSADASGHVLISIRQDNGGQPGVEITNTSILSTAIGSAYSYLPAYVMDAPDLVLGTTYWAVISIQGGSGTYYLQKTTGNNGYSSADGVVFNPLSAAITFKVYQSPVGGITGFTRRNSSTGVNRTLFSQGSKLYALDDLGNVTQIGSNINSAATTVFFDTVDDKTFYCDSAAGTPTRLWDGTTDSVLSGPPFTARNLIVWQNRLFLLSGNTRYDFSDLYNFTSYPSVNFFYVPSPKSSDPVTGHVIFRDDLHIFTNKSKHIIMGSDISTFTRKEAVGTMGAVGQKAIAVDHDHIYFMAPDKQIYRWNGASDELISDHMQPEFSGISDPTKVRFHIFRNQLRVYYSKDAGPNNLMALYDIPSGEWFIDDGRPIEGSINLPMKGNTLLEFSSRVGWVFTGETGYSDLGKKINWKYWTNYKIYGSGASLKRVKRFRPFVHYTGTDYTMLIGKDMDYANNPDMREYTVASGGAKWGQFVFGDGTKFGSGKQLIDNRAGMSGRGKHIQYRFEISGVEIQAELEGYFAMIKIGRPR